ncbi:MFS transporter [Geosporobacter ferrireducens]|nr:MFS transporter [Geosporobacter ferrireducens]
MLENKRMGNMLIILIFGLMLLQGFMDNMRGVLIPSIREFFQIDYTSLAWMMLISTLGYIGATFSGGLLIEHIGQQKVIFIGLTGLAAGAFGISSAWNFFALIFFMFILGSGIGFINIGASTITPILFVKNQAIMMNLLHFFYGFGATLGPRYAGILLASNYLWRDVYRYSILVIGVLGVYFLTCSFPKVERSEKKQKVAIQQIASDKRIILFSMLLGFYVAGEIGIANWFVNYLQQGRDMTPLQSASYLSLFFMIFTFGRLVGGFIAEKLGYMRSIILYVAMAIFCLGIGIFGSKPFIIMISVSGFFFSIVYPTVMALLIKTFDSGINSILGFVMAFSSMINMLANWMVGKTNDLFGVAIGFYLVLFYMSIVLLLLLLLSRNIKSLSDNNKNMLSNDETL